jgi:hypothetical protein
VFCVIELYHLNNICIVTIEIGNLCLKNHMMSIEYISS